MENWFTVEKISEDTFAISEYKHWEETHCYLIIGEQKCVLIDTGMGISNIKEITDTLTDKPIVAIPTHTHWDHIGGLKEFDEFYLHEIEVPWLNGEFPLSLDYIKSLVIEIPFKQPKSFNLENYTIFQGIPTMILKDGDEIDLGNRQLKVIHTPGHSPGHICLYEADREWLYTGDLVYMDKLTAFFPTSDPVAYKQSIDKIRKLDVKKILSSHHKLEIPTSLIAEVWKGFSEIEEKGKLHHGRGLFTFENFQIEI